MKDNREKKDWSSSITRVAKAYNEISKCINPVQLIKVDLTTSQIKVLMSFSDKDSFTMTELSKAHFVSVSTMTSMVDRLIHNGFLQRKKEDKDRRVVRIFLTAEGKKTVKDLLRVRRQELKKFFLELDDRERGLFVKSIENVAYYLSTVRKTRLLA